MKETTGFVNGEQRSRRKEEFAHTENKSKFTPEALRENLLTDGRDNSGRLRTGQTFGNAITPLDNNHDGVAD